MAAPAIAFVGDDFTGASDTLATLARGGLKTRLYTRLPEELPGDLDAIGLATELRAMGPAEARMEMAKIAPRMAALGACITHFKVCSTFDSAAGAGNIAASVDVLAEAVGADLVVILGGQPSLKRYCLFGTLFAGASDGEVHRIDRHPVMSRHPITPMAEADLRRHLALQGWADVGLVDYRAYAAGAPALREELMARIAVGGRRILFDVACTSDLAVIGEALWRIAGEKRLVCVGASSVAEAILAVARPESAAASWREMPAIVGPTFVLSGSRSPATAAQIEVAGAYEKFVVPPANLKAGTVAASELASRSAELLAAGRNVLVAVAGEAGGLSGRDLSRALAAFASDMVGRVRPGLLAVAGGDTSSAVVSGLDVEAFEFVCDIDPGVSMVRAVGGPVDGLPLVLKGGQMGARDLFDRLQFRSDRLHFREGV